MHANRFGCRGGQEAEAALAGAAAEGGSPKLDTRSTSSLVLGYDVREKELGKLHKAAWLGDVPKVQQLAKKDASPLDKDNRYQNIISITLCSVILLQ